MARTEGNDVGRLGQNAPGPVWTCPYRFGRWETYVIAST